VWGYMIFAFILFFCFALFMIMAAIKDAAIMKIPNWISLATFGAFILLIPFIWTGLPALGEHFLIGSMAFIAGFTMFALGWLGGGDAKLFAATAFWWTWPDFITYFSYTAILGGVLAIAILVGRKFAPVWLSTSSWGYGLFKEQTKMPYGLALAAGALLTLPQSDVWRIALNL